MNYLAGLQGDNSDQWDEASLRNIFDALMARADEEKAIADEEKARADFDLAAFVLVLLEDGTGKYPGKEIFKDRNKWDLVRTVQDLCQRSFAVVLSFGGKKVVLDDPEDLAPCAREKAVYLGKFVCQAFAMRDAYNDGGAEGQKLTKLKDERKLYSLVANTES